MGGMCSTPRRGGEILGEEMIRDKAIGKVLIADYKKEQQRVKLLLLGGWASGKSTVFKQMKILYGKNFSKEELEETKEVVHGNIISNLRVVVDNLETPLLSPELVEEFTEIVEGTPITPKVGVLLKRIWNDPGTRRSWDKRDSLKIQDSLGYYCDDIDRIAAQDYMPVPQDILYARVPTSEVIEEQYVIDGVEFLIYDVSGQRNERKKWIHIFDAVTAVIFVAAINEYDQVVYDDPEMNRIDEALLLFDEICNSKWFAKTSMILFLNKKDLFEEKLFRVPYRVSGGRNDDFLGPFAGAPGVAPEDAIKAASDHIVQRFLSKNRGNGEIYHHLTCATDTRNVHVIFNACKDIILKNNLRGSGFME